ncbi:MAG TPA: TOMM precursor leader peptide-binding protein, partial [Planctomycetaceae bacterium]|nr:TOMM precursor leader peptide-binding protein [Planctomycetaceae bacterium]
MLRRPRFKPHLHVDVVPGSGLFLLSEYQQTVLQGRLYEVVAPLLDGRPVEEVCGELRGEVTPSQIFYTVNKLDGSGYLYDDGQAIVRSDAAAWSVIGLDPAAVLTRRAESSVSITAIGVDPLPFRTLLQSMQIDVRDEGDLQVVLVDHYLRRELGDINRAAMESGRPWILIRPLGAQIWVGPLFRPEVTGCWECLADRIRANSPVTACLESLRGDEGLGA